MIGKGQSNLSFPTMTACSCQALENLRQGIICRLILPKAFRQGCHQGSDRSAAGKLLTISTGQVRCPASHVSSSRRSPALVEPPPSTASPPDAPGAIRRTPTNPASLWVTISSKATSRTAAGFSDAIGPMICVRLAWRNPARLSGLATSSTRSPEAANHSSRPTAPADKRSRDTADILARHLGKPEALAAEVFRPKPVPSPRPPAPEAPQQTGSAPALSPEVEQALTGMAAELKGLRSTMELMAEQMGKLVALGSQQIEAIARLAPLMVQSAEGISGSLREVPSALQLIPTISTPAGEALRPSAKAAGIEESPALQLNLLQGLDQAVGPEAKSAPIAAETRRHPGRAGAPRGTQHQRLRRALRLLWSSRSLMPSVRIDSTPASDCHENCGIRPALVRKIVSCSIGAGRPLRSNVRPRAG